VASCSGVVSATICATSPEGEQFAHADRPVGRGHADRGNSSLMRGPPTSKEKAPLAATATRRCSPLASDRAPERRAECVAALRRWIGRIELEIQIGTICTSMRGMITPSGARIVWSSAELLAAARGRSPRDERRLDRAGQLAVDRDVKLRQHRVVARPRARLGDADREDRHAQLEEEVVVVGSEDDQGGRRASARAPPRAARTAALTPRPRRSPRAIASAVNGLCGMPRAPTSSAMTLASLASKRRRAIAADRLSGVTKLRDALNAGTSVVDCRARAAACSPTLARVRDTGAAFAPIVHVRERHRQPGSDREAVAGCDSVWMIEPGASTDRGRCTQARIATCWRCRRTCSALWALGRALDPSALSGDRSKVGPYEGLSKAVGDLDSIRPARAGGALNEGVMAAGEALDPPTDFLILTAANPPGGHRSSASESKLHAGAHAFPDQHRLRRRALQRLV